MSKNLKDEMEDWSASSRMPFGKHKDACLATLPKDYKLWLSEQEWVQKEWPYLLKALRNIKQINLRDQGDWSEYSGFPIGKNAGTPIASLTEFNLKWYVAQEWFRESWPNLTNYICELHNLEIEY
jgi:uncharacterized protein (DUF3820 family)